MASISLEVKVMSCRDLKAFNFFQKLSVYVVVSIIGDANEDRKKNHKRKVVVQRQKTPIHRDGDGNPEWNHTMHFDLKEISKLDPGQDLFVKFDMRSEGIIYSNKTIGEVCVLLKDLIDESKGETVRFVSYQVETTDGKPNGVLNFSYKAASHDDLLKNESSPSSILGMDMYLATDKVKYPTLEHEPEQEDSSSICYPSVEEDYHFLLPRISMSSQKLYYPTVELGNCGYTGGVGLLGQVEGFDYYKARRLGRSGGRGNELATDDDDMRSTEVHKFGIAYF